MKNYNLGTRSGVLAIFIIGLIAFAGFSTVIIQRTQASKQNAPAAKTSAPAAAQPLVIGTCDVATAGNPVEVEATAGTTGPTAYASVGAAFAAINAGTHQGDINVEICFSSNEGTTPATLNSGDATPAVYNSVIIRPLADGLTVSGNPVTGFGVIQLNGADNVTLDGDNPNSMGTNRNLTISNTTTNTVIANSAVRIATSAAVTSANNNIIRNCALLGNVTGGNNSAITSTTGSSNSSFGIYVGGNGGATATGAPTAITSVTTNVAPSGTTINNLLIDNNSVSQAARAIVFNGATAAVSTGVTISNNTIGAPGPPTPANPPFTSPATTVYTKGIWVAGTAAVSVTGNTINNVMSFVATTITAVEMVAPVTNPTINNNNISSIANNGTTSIVKAVLVSSATGVYNISGNTVSNVQTLAGASGTAGIECTSTTTNGVIEKNRVTRVHGRSTGTFGAYGINVTNGTTINIRNNFVSDINMDMTGGAAFSTQFSVFGIRLAGGTGHRVYHNSVNLFGPLFGTPNSSILTAAFCPTATTITGMDVRNNIFANTMTGGTTSIAHVSMFLPSSATVAFNLTINNNDYFANATAGSAGIAHVGTTYTAVPAGPTTFAGLYTAANFDPTMTTPNTNLRAYTSILSAAGTNDNASRVVDPLFSSPTDLHLLGTSTMIDAGVNVMIADDIDNQARPNGAQPDIGADEFYPAPGILQFSSANYAGNEGATVPVTVTRVSGSSGSVTVDVTVSNGTATGGAMCGPGVDYVAPGTQTLTFGDTVTSQSINIQLCTDAAFDPNETINFSLSNPGGGATIGTPNSAVLTITDVPPPFTGNVNVGTGQNYTSLTNPGGLFEAINLGGVSGNVVIEITSDLTGESGAVPLNQQAGGFSITIKPSGAARTITSTASAVSVIKLNDADNVTIDGSLGGMDGGIDRSLSIINTNTAASTTCIWVASAVNGAQNNTIQNLNLEGGVNQSVTNVFNFAIISSSSASILTGGADNDNNTYNNNFIKKVSVGIISIGGLASNMNQSTTISNNLIGPSAFGIDEVSTLGLLMFNENLALVTGNELRFIGDAALTGGSSGRDHVGISLCTGSASWAGGTPPTVVGTMTNANISRNTIHDIVERATFSAVGIVNNCLGTNPTNNTIANNMIYNIQSNGTSGDQTVGIAISNGNGDKVVHNSIYLTGDLDPAGATSSSTSSFGINVSVATPTNLTLKDNISVMDLTSNTGTLFHAAINIISPTYNWGTGGSDYNDWFAGPSAQARVGATAGSGGTFHTTLASWQTATSQDANSLSVDPLFVSATNLHIQPTSPVINMGTAIPGVTADFDNQTRDATPDIGADEIVAGTLDLSAATYSVGESAGTVTITVNRTGGTDGAVAVNYSLSDGTATGGAMCGAGVDYVNTGGTVNFANGQSSQTFTVTICPDAAPEGNETFNVTLSGATGGATIGTQSSAVVTITDDDVAVPGTLQFSAATYTTGEGAVQASIGVTRTGGSDGAVSVDYATVMGGTATGGADCMTAGVDYVTTSGTLNWANGDSSGKSFNITICQDALDEPDETINLALSNATGGASIGTQSTAVLTITDDDATPSLSITDVSLNEGNAGTTNFVFNVNLSAASGQTVTVHYQTADGSATVADNDYVAISDTTLTFDPGQTSKQVTVLVNGDVSVEPNENFFVNLSMATNATISDNQGQGTIQNDDFILPVITISDARVLEGNSGTATAQFTVTLTGTTQGPASVHYSTSNGTAVASPSPQPGDDYVAVPDTLLNFQMLEPNGDAPDGDPVLTATINVTVNGDTLKEANETFFVNLSMPVNAVISDNQGVGIIVDDDRAYTADVDHDRKSDYVVFRPSEGVWYSLQSTNGFTNYRFFGTNGDRPVPGDYDGDGTMDLAVFRDSTASWYIEQSSNFGFVQQQWGLSGDKPVQGDYDGDGKTDIGVFRNGDWYIIKSSGGVLTASFGTSGDRAVPGDYDGDAKTDFAVYRNGEWYILRSSNNVVMSQVWGVSSDQPVPADYDGDGSYDVAVFRNGAWYINGTLSGPRAVTWGTSGDVPVMADYDGDGTADIAIYRNGDWYIIRSSNQSVQTQNWGLGSDIPAPAAYLPQ